MNVRWVVVVVVMGRFVFGKCAVSQESCPLGIKAVVFIWVGCRSSVERRITRDTQNIRRW